MTEKRKEQLIKLVDYKAQAIVDGGKKRKSIGSFMSIADAKFSIEDMIFIVKRVGKWERGRLPKKSAEPGFKFDKVATRTLVK